MTGQDLIEEKADGTTRAPEWIVTDHPVFGSVPHVRPEVTIRRSSGALYVRTPWRLDDVPRSLIEYLREADRTVPDRIAFASRLPGGGWREVSYSGMRATADRIAQALLDRGYSQGDVIAILSPNSIEQMQLTLGAMTVGVTVAPISMSYALFPAARGRLVAAFSQCNARMLFLADPAQIAEALDLLDLTDVECVSVADAPGMTPFDTLLSAPASNDVEAAYALTGPDTIAKILFTSGSTGTPKGVVNTQRMLCSNQRMTELVSLRDPSEPPVVLDWLPWHHTFGGNFVVGEALRNHSSFYIDEGKPVAGALIEKTIKAIREIRPTTQTNVPAAYSLLAEAMEKDATLRDAFFSRMKLLRYGGAGLDRSTYERLQLLAEESVGRRIPMICAFAMTETSPSVTALHWPYDGVGCIGLPFPGMQMKLVELSDNRYDLRLKGPCVFPGYHRAPQKTGGCFDDEGYFVTGDALRFVDEAAPEKGLMYDGRVSEDFKLATGTRVQVGSLRLGVLEAAKPLFAEVVVTGEKYAAVGLLVWATPLVRSNLVSDDEGVLVPSTDLRAEIVMKLTDWNRRHPGSSFRIDRVLLMADPPDMGAGEINDKNYINQRAVLATRDALVVRLYAEAKDPAVVVIPSGRD